MGSMRRARGVLRIKPTKTVSVTGRANCMCSGLANSAALIPTPNPSINALLAQIGVVNKAEILVRTGVHGAAAARNAQRSILVGMMETEVTTVQGYADLCVGLDQAVAVIQAGGLDVALIGSYVKPILSAKQATAGGPVALDANAAVLTGRTSKKTQFNWQSTADGRIFVTLPSTPKSKTTVANLPPLSTYGFRVSVTSSDGTMGEWSQVVFLLIR